MIIIITILKNIYSKRRVNIPWKYWMCTILTFDDMENNYEVYMGKDCMKIFCESLTERTRKITFEKNKMMPLTNEKYKSYPNQTNCPICKQNIQNEWAIDKDRDHRETIAIIQVNTEVLHKTYVIYKIVSLKRFLRFITMNRNMINILSQKS